METEERKQTSEKMLSVFKLWKENPEAPDAVKALKEIIDFSSKNGIDVIVKIPKNMLDQETVLKPMTMGEVGKSQDGDSVVFEVPSELTFDKIQPGKRVKLAVENFRGAPSIQIVSPIRGIIAAFSSYQITSLEIK